MTHVSILSVEIILYKFFMYVCMYALSKKAVVDEKAADEIITTDPNVLVRKTLSVKLRVDENVVDEMIIDEVEVTRRIKPGSGKKESGRIKTKKLKVIWFNKTYVEVCSSLQDC